MVPFKRNQYKREGFWGKKTMDKIPSSHLTIRKYNIIIKYVNKTNGISLKTTLNSKYKQNTTVLIIPLFVFYFSYLFKNIPHSSIVKDQQMMMHYNYKILWGQWHANSLQPQHTHTHCLDSLTIWAVCSPLARWHCIPRRSHCLMEKEGRNNCNDKYDVVTAVTRLVWNWSTQMDWTGI